MSLAIDIDERLIAQAVELLEACRLRGETIVTAESCTGGLVAATLTAIPGSSDVFERGFVTYANTAKSEMLGVPYWLIERHGAVSEDVARAWRAARSPTRRQASPSPLPGSPGQMAARLRSPLVSYISRPRGATRRSLTKWYCSAISGGRRSGDRASSARLRFSAHCCEASARRCRP